MNRKIVMITGGSGFVGQLLQVGLRRRGYGVRLFDQYRGTAITLLRRRYFGTSKSAVGQAAAHAIFRTQKAIQSRFLGTPLLRPSRDQILDIRSRLTSRFAGSYAVIHLAGIPHPYQAGTIDSDFQRINYDGSVNVFEAAKALSVPKFIFASSGQVYGINNPVRVDQFPMLESNYLPTLADGQTMYGFLKYRFEQYVASACVDGGTQAISLRLEFPGFQSRSADNLYASTSVDNLVSGVVSALETNAPFGFEAFNLVDDHVDESIVDVQAYLRRAWPAVPNFTTGNESLLSVAKAKALLGYAPTRGGTYVPASLVW
jgi:nucleoside-diphosphate-sugar epimerase